MDTTSFLPFEYHQFGTVDTYKLHTDAPRPPRYLIRVHSQLSQGHMNIASFISAAEYLALQNGTCIPQIDEYEPRLFERHTHNHLTNYKGSRDEPFHSPFVSLTVSLRLALAWAKMRSLWGHREIKIAVLDTTTITTDNCDCGQYCDNPFHQNPIWPANMIYKACHGVSKDFPDEFLAFGHVRGTFKVCTFAELETTFLNAYLPELARLPYGQRYEELPVTLESLWQSEQPLHLGDQETIIYVAKQLSNDNLLIPMVAFVLCIRRRSIDDTRVLDTVVRAARLVEKQKTYDFLGYYDAFPVIDFFSKRDFQQIVTADSVELVQTSAILERVKLRFAEIQEREAKTMWDCTTVALMCRYFCPRRIGDAVSKTCLLSRRVLNTDLSRAFSRLQTAVFRSKFSGLRLLRDALMSAGRIYQSNSGILTSVSVRCEHEHEFWTRTFGEIATNIEEYDGSSTMNPAQHIVHSSQSERTIHAQNRTADGVSGQVEHPIQTTAAPRKPADTYNSILKPLTNPNINVDDKSNSGQTTNFAAGMCKEVIIERKHVLFTSDEKSGESLAENVAPKSETETKRRM